VRTKTSQQSEKILSVASRLFAAHRFHETRMEDIAAAAEVGKGTLYRYFKDKDELYTALLVRAAEQLEARLVEVVEQGQDARGKLEGVVGAIITYFDERPHLLDLIQHAEAMQRSDRIAAWQKTRETNIRLVRSVFDAARECGEFEIEDTHLAALLLLGSLRAVLRFGERPRRPDLVHHIVEKFLTGHALPAAKPNGRNNSVTAPFQIPRGS
jgi:AcrR family transcriptional regulator